MKRFVLLITICFSTGLALAQAPSVPLVPVADRPQVAADPAATFRVNVDIVTLDASVVTKKGARAVGPLSPEDFVIYDDGVPQRITYLSQDELPLSVVLLFDLTDSVRPVLKSLANGALAALQHLKPQDEVAVMVYAASATLLQDFTTDRALAAAAVTTASKMKSGEAAFFNEGLFRAAQQVANAKNPNTRRVIIWLTDNVPNFPSDEIKRHHGRSLADAPLHSEKQALDALFKSGATVCSLLQLSDLSEDALMSRNAHWGESMLERAQFPPGDVYRYAQQTGGEVAESNAKKMPAKLAGMIDSIRSRYTLGYRPSVASDGKLHEIRVRVSPEVERRAGRVNVVAKKAYFR